MSEYLDLADYRMRVASHYATARQAPDPAQARETWRWQRDLLFATHPQTPLDDLSDEYSTPFAPYDPAYRVLAEPRSIGGEHVAIAHSADGTTPFLPFATISGEVPTGEFELTLYWLQGYGGGIFLPFRDATSGDTTYGGGRYLLDTVKGADLGRDAGKLVVDFNFAYHPSCVYSYRWSCPLAPPANHLDIPIPVGELLVT